QPLAAAPGLSPRHDHPRAGQRRQEEGDDAEPADERRLPGQQAADDNVEERIGNAEGEPPHITLFGGTAEVLKSFSKLSVFAGSWQIAAGLMQDETGDRSSAVLLEFDLRVDDFEEKLRSRFREEREFRLVRRLFEQLIPFQGDLDRKGRRDLIRAD